MIGCNSPRPVEPLHRHGQQRHLQLVAIVCKYETMASRTLSYVALTHASTGQAFPASTGGNARASQ